MLFIGAGGSLRPRSVCGFIYSFVRSHVVVTLSGYHSFFLWLRMKTDKHNYVKWQWVHMNLVRPLIAARKSKPALHTESDVFLQ